MLRIQRGTGRSAHFLRNFGAGQGERIKTALKYALGTVAVFAIFWTAVTLAVPNLFIQVFMKPTEEILAMAPGIIRTYCISFLLLPLNIFSTYYFQALIKQRAAFVVSVSRGLVLSGILIYLLPAAFEPERDLVDDAHHGTCRCDFVVNRMVTYTKQLPKGRSAEA